MNAVASPEWKAITWSRHAVTTVVVEDPSVFTGTRVIAECETVEDARLIAAAREMHAVLDDLGGCFDKEIYPEQATENFDAPDDREYTVTITAKQWRALGRALGKAVQS